MEKYKLSQIIKDIVSSYEEANPFSDDFDLNKFKEYLTNEINSVSKKYQLENDDEGFDTISILLELNSIYEELMLQIEELIYEINMDSVELFGEILSVTNFDYFNYYLIQKDNIEKDKKNLHDLSDSFSYKVTNIYGDELNSQDAIDTATDTAIELLNIILGFSYERNNSNPDVPVKQRINYIRKMLLYTNLLNNIKNSVEFYKYEFAELQKTEKDIKIKLKPAMYSLLKVAGKQRESNLIKEATVYTFKYFKGDINVPTYSIANKTLIIENKTNTVKSKSANLFAHMSSMVFPTFYFHLLDSKTSIKNVGVQNIFELLIALRSVFLEIKGEEIVEKIVETQDVSFSPIRIDKKKLVKYLIKNTKLKEPRIVALLDAMSSDLSPELNFWRNPLIKHKNYYYFLITPLLHGHLTYQVDNIMDKILSIKSQENYFIDYVKFELGSKTISNYIFKIIDEKKLIPLSLNNKNLLVYEMSSTILLLQVCLFNYALDSKEHNESLQRLANASDILENSKSKILKELHKITDNPNKEIISVILTNHTLLSGINIENNIVLDIHLLSNYLHTGEFKRGFIITGGGKLDSEEISSIKYYNSEEEFNNNFHKFCLIPNPIDEILKNTFIKEYPIVFKEMEPQIIREAVDIKPLHDSIWRKVSEIQYHLRQLYYFEHDAKLQQNIPYIGKELTFLIPQVFSFFAIDKNDRAARIEILNEFKNVGIVGMSYLILSLNNLIHKLGSKKIIPNKLADDKNDSSFNYEDADKLLKEILKANSTTRISISTIHLEHNLNEEQVEEVLEYIIHLLSSIVPKYYTEEELENHLFLLTIFIGIGKNNKKYEEYFINGCINFIDSLNYNNHYQKARDFCEELLEYSFLNENPPLLGWLSMFKCYIRQHNVYDAAFYGSLYISSIIALPEIEEYKFVDIIYNAMLFFRGFGYTELTDVLFNALKSFNLSEYDKQKNTLSYFYSKFSYSIDNFPVFLQEVNEYLTNTIDEIISYGQKGAYPWVGFIYNIKNTKSLDISANMPLLETFLLKLEKEIDDETLAKLKATLFPIDETTKLIFRDSILKTLETRNFDDFSFEISELELVAKNVIQLSLNPLDIDNLLLAGIVINDNNLTFKEINDVPYQAPFLKGGNKELREKISHYSEVILPNLPIKEKQLICWMFNVTKNVYLLKIDSKKTFSLTQLISWDLHKMNEWISNISNFYFDDKGDYPINSQESDYKALLEELSFSNLQINEKCEEILICTDLTLAKFPHNLLQNTFNNTNYTNHEDIIKEYISIENNDFISFNKPITNIISLEWIIENGKEKKYKNEELTLEAWIPKNDEDIAVNIGYENLRPLIIDKYKSQIHIDTLPDKPLSSAINIFLAHGGKGIDGFRTLYTKHNEGHAFIKDKGIKNLFGKGVIAVIFVCNSASISNVIYAQKLVSFTQEILSLGYQTVIAPAWSLNPDICSVWLEGFIDSLKTNKTVGEAAHLANYKVSQQGYNEYHGFYAPSGWAAMHVYGNPNILFCD